MRSLFALAALVVCLPAAADQYVQGYCRKDGTCVPGHFRSSPNGTTVDNYSTRGNVNMNSGRVSSRELDVPSTPAVPATDRTVYIGPKGGRYYVTATGQRVYLRDK